MSQYGAQFDLTAERWAVLENEHDRHHPDWMNSPEIRRAALIGIASNPAQPLADRLSIALQVIGELEAAPEPKVWDDATLTGKDEQVSTEEKINDDGRNTAERRDERAKWTRDIANMLRRASTEVREDLRPGYLAAAEWLDPSDAPTTEMRGEEQERTEEKFATGGVVPADARIWIGDTPLADWVAPKPKPRTWSLPPEPGLEVTRLRSNDETGYEWVRVAGSQPGWMRADLFPLDGLIVPWLTLLGWGPLVDATPPPGGEGE